MKLKKQINGTLKPDSNFPNCKKKPFTKQKQIKQKKNILTFQR